MRQLLNATHAASVEHLDEDDLRDFERNLDADPSRLVDPETGVVDRSRNVDLLLAAMGGPPPPGAPGGQPAGGEG